MIHLLFPPNRSVKTNSGGSHVVISHSTSTEVLVHVSITYYRTTYVVRKVSGAHPQISCVTIVLLFFKCSFFFYWFRFKWFSFDRPFALDFTPYFRDCRKCCDMGWAHNCPWTVCLLLLVSVLDTDFVRCSVCSNWLLFRLYSWYPERSTIKIRFPFSAHSASERLLYKEVLQQCTRRYLTERRGLTLIDERPSLRGVSLLKNWCYNVCFQTTHIQHTNCSCMWRHCTRKMKCQRT
jgi:hypothetical protein